MARRVTHIGTLQQSHDVADASVAIVGILNTMGSFEQVRQERQTMDRISMAISSGITDLDQIVSIAGEGARYSPGVRGFLQRFASSFAPPSQIEAQFRKGMMGQIFRDPLYREQKLAQIEATKSLTASRKEAAKHALPDRMLRQADRYLRVVDDIMSEYWYTPKGPYRDKLLKDVQENRKKALDLIEKYAPDSEAAAEVKNRLKILDDDIAADKPSQPGIDEQIQSQPTENITGSLGELVNPKAVSNEKQFVVDSYPAPKNKFEFDDRLLYIQSEEEKDRWFELYYKPEYGKGR